MNNVDKIAEFRRKLTQCETLHQASVAAAKTCLRGSAAAFSLQEVVLKHCFSIDGSNCIISEAYRDSVAPVRELLPSSANSTESILSRVSLKEHPIIRDIDLEYFERGKIVNFINTHYGTSIQALDAFLRPPGKKPMAQSPARVAAEKLRNCLQAEKDGIIDTVSFFRLQILEVPTVAKQ